VESNILVVVRVELLLLVGIPFQAMLAANMILKQRLPLVQMPLRVN
jgi:hypothetical protein